MDTNKMREDFEVSMQGMTFSVDLSRGNHGCYTSLRTHELYCSWVASWQASRAAVVVELPAWEGVNHHRLIPLRATEAAIKAQGMKVAP